MNIQVYIHNTGRLLLKDHHKNLRLTVESHKKLFKAFGLNHNLYKEHIVYENLNNTNSYILLAGTDQLIANQEQLSIKKEEKKSESNGVQETFNGELNEERIHEKTFLIEELVFQAGHYIYLITEVD